MPTVTGLHSDPREAGCVIVEVDGRRFGALSTDRAQALGLAVGTEVAGALGQGLEEAAQEEAAYRAGVRALGRRGRAQADLMRWLLRRGHAAGAASSAVGRLAARGLLDDGTFAAAFAAERVRRGHGPARVLRDLLARGVERSVAERAIRDVLEVEGVEPTEEIRRLAARRLGQLRDLSLPIRRRRVLAYLARRGHHGIEPRQVVDELLRS